MKRLIDAEALKKAIMLKDDVAYETWDELYDSVLEEIDNAPTIEPFERIGAICNENCGGYRPQGEWQRIGIANECSVCGAMYSISFHEKCYDHLIMNFCPNCGADMRGDANDG